jgi:hypothetical protein
MQGMQRGDSEGVKIFKRSEKSVDIFNESGYNK